VTAWVPFILVVAVMLAFVGVPVFLSWWRNRG
jgi:ABC-type transport system involved in cytochrome c biogenesis permease subunit